MPISKTKYKLLLSFPEKNTKIEIEDDEKDKDEEISGK